MSVEIFCQEKRAAYIIKTYEMPTPEKYDWEQPKKENSAHIITLY